MNDPVDVSKLGTPSPEGEITEPQTPSPSGERVPELPEPGVVEE